jgi:hypothetical protein|tara:strand:+ start:4756 stop:5277 length:522 start_codon:yes stop_codon:yes gene_type:complete
MTSSQTTINQQLYDNHLQKAPAKPKELQYLYEDTSSPALLYGMHHKTQNVCVLADEGAGTLNRLVTPGLSALMSSWSGMPIKVERRTTESFSLHGQRMAFLLSIQPGPFQEYRDRKSDLAKAAGLWARTLVCGPISTIGYRETVPNEDTGPEPDEYLKRIRDLIAQSANQEGN